MRAALVIGSCIGLSAVALTVLLTYGHYYYPQRFQKRVAWTNLIAAQQTVGKPVRTSTNPDGTVCWDYTHWWSGVARVYFDTNGNYFRTFTEF